MYLVQIISLVIYAVVMCGSLYDFKRTVIIWVPFSFLFSPQVCVLYNPPITALTVAVNLSLVMFYFLFKRGYNNTYNNEYFFFMPAIKVMCCSFLLATVFSDMPFMSSFNRIVKTTIESFGMIIILYRVLNTKDDIFLFVKILAISAIIFCLDGLIEGLTHINPWGDFLYFFSRCDEETSGRGWHIPYSISGTGLMRFGMIRCYSVFAYHIIFGFSCCLVLYILMVMYKYKENIFSCHNTKNNIIYYVLFGLLSIGVILCNSKGPMLLLIFILLTQYGFKELINPLLLTPIIIIVLLILIYFPDYFLNFTSLVDSDVAEEGGGSSVALRQRQMTVAMNLFSRSPLCGNGIGSVVYYKQFGFEEILGAESIWLKLLPDQGILGVFAYLYIYINLYVNSKNIMPLKTSLFFLVGIFIFDTTNGTAYGILFWWIGIFLCIRRYYELKNLQYECY